MIAPLERVLRPGRTFSDVAADLLGAIGLDLETPVERDHLAICSSVSGYHPETASYLILSRDWRGECIADFSVADYADEGEHDRGPFMLHLSIQLVGIGWRPITPGPGFGSLLRRWLDALFGRHLHLVWFHEPMDPVSIREGIWHFYLPLSIDWLPVTPTTAEARQEFLRRLWLPIAELEAHLPPIARKAEAR